MKTELTVTVRLRIGVGTTKKVKVKAHIRVVNGKTVKVRSTTDAFGVQSSENRVLNAF